jgi:hypothetical protein
LELDGGPLNGAHDSFQVDGPKGTCCFSEFQLTLFFLLRGQLFLLRNLFIWNSMKMKTPGSPVWFPLGTFFFFFEEKYFLGHETDFKNKF